MSPERRCDGKSVFAGSVPVITYGTTLHLAHKYLYFIFLCIILLLATAQLNQLPSVLLLDMECRYFNMGALAVFKNLPFLELTLSVPVFYFL